jgi:FkbM family methyltransferase
MSYSQFDEEEFILKFFAGFTGRFLDIGAFDGVSMSNTRALLERGWRGMLVEPLARNCVKLQENCAVFGDRAVLVNAGVQAKRGLSRFYCCDVPGREWAATLDHDHIDDVVQNLNRQPVLIPCVEPAQLWDKFAPFDFITIDAEWMDWEIAQAMPEDMIAAARLICIEPQNLYYKEMREFFIARGMKLVHTTPPNLFFARG